MTDRQTKGKGADELTWEGLEEKIFAILKNDRRSAISDLLDQLAESLHSNFPHYTGVYMYLLEGTTLVLGPFRGRPTEHTRIPVGAGVCGRAARVKATVVVDDVNADAEYIACSLQTKSEIVVPIMRGDHVLGEIDIDSDVAAAFNSRDREFLETLANELGKRFPS
jgi:putative methionine-R-sulfoxide reductase with GAF domain